jgi:hypothetical protein
MVRPGRVALAAFALLACTQVTPSRAPLSPPEKNVAAALRPSSSRAYEPADTSEDRDEIEITVQPSDDDDDDSVRSTKRAGAANDSRSPSSAVQASPPAAKTVATKPGPACSVGTGAAPDCGLLPAATSCLGASLAHRTCETLGGAVDPSVAGAWLACMRDPASGSPCDSGRIVACGLRAVGGACVDGAYHDLCRELSDECRGMADEITQPVCERLIAAWKPERRSQMIDCLRHGCETGGFGACLP